jgi:uncharacterized membrane protein YdjX (TVP38/TMEM64 family)
MKNNNIVKIIIFVGLIAISFMIFKYFNLQQYLSVDGLNKYSYTIINYQLLNPIKFLLLFFVLYVLLIVFCISGTIFLDVLAGFVLGILGGTLLIMLSYTIGIILNYLVVNYLLKDFFESKFKNSKFFANMPSNKNIFITLTSLRMVPVLPFWSLNVLASILKVSRLIFITSTAIGIIPIAFVYALLGNNLREVFMYNHNITSEMLFNYKVWLPLVFLSIISILPLCFKKNTKNK